MARTDVASFGKAANTDDQGRHPVMDQFRAAEVALSRAEGALVFADMSQPAVAELRRLFEAVAPLIAAEEIAS